MACVNRSHLCQFCLVNQTLVRNSESIHVQTSDNCGSECRDVNTQIAEKLYCFELLKLVVPIHERISNFPNPIALGPYVSRAVLDFVFLKDILKSP